MMEDNTEYIFFYGNKINFPIKILYKICIILPRMVIILIYQSENIPYEYKYK